MWDRLLVDCNIATLEGGGFGIVENGAVGIADGKVVFGGTRADEHAMRRAGASYEEIARAGGGIASTVKRTAAASDEELLEQSRRRLHALMRGGCTTVEVKSGYGLDPKSEIRLLKVANRLREGEAVRVVPTLLALHAL